MTPRHQKDERETLSIREAAAILGVSYTHAYTLAKREGAIGSVPVVQVGSRLVVPRQRLLAFARGEAS